MCRKATPVYLLGKKPLDHIRVKRAWAAAPELHVGVSTTNAGRSLLSLPRPYASQEPRLGLPGTSLPVITNVQAGSWLMALVCSVLTTARSSTHFAVYGNNSLTQRPQLPCCSNLNIDGATGNRAWPLVIVVIR